MTEPCPKRPCGILPFNPAFWQARSEGGRVSVLAERHPATAQTKNTPRASVASAQMRVKEGGLLSHQATMLLKRANPINGMAMPATTNIAPTTCNVVEKRERGAANHRESPNMSRKVAPVHSPSRVCQRERKARSVVGERMPHTPKPTIRTDRAMARKTISIPVIAPCFLAGCQILRRPTRFPGTQDRYRG